MLTRLISQTGNTELIEITPELYISKYFYAKGYRIESDIPEKYSKHTLLQELKSRILDARYRVWDADGVKSVVFADGTRYSLDEVRLLENKTEDEIIKIHNSKKVFEGEVVE